MLTLKKKFVTIRHTNKAEQISSHLWGLPTWVNIMVFNFGIDAQVGKSACALLILQDVWRCIRY